MNNTRGLLSFACFYLTFIMQTLWQCRIEWFSGAGNVRKKRSVKSSFHVSTVCSSVAIVLWHYQHVLIPTAILMNSKFISTTAVIIVLIARTERVEFPLIG